MINCEKVLYEVKGTSYITSIPIDEFYGLSEFDNFVKEMNGNGIGIVMHHEQSNFHQGVLVQIYDKDTCEVKNYL